MIIKKILLYIQPDPNIVLSSSGAAISAIANVSSINNNA